MSSINPRDRSRSHVSKTFSMVKKNTQPPKGQGGWMAETRELLESDAYRTLSINARRVLDRVKIEHISHGRNRNGSLIITHDQFIEYGVTSDLVADAIEECAFKGLMKVQRGRAADGTPHASLYTLTFDGTHDGLPATNGWRKFTMDDAKEWTVRRKNLMDERAKVAARRKNSPLGDRLIAPLGNFLASKAS
jgi:hypothetical protein